MTQVSPAPSISGSASIRQTPSGNGGTSGFSLALVVAPGARKAAPEPAAETPKDARQIDPKRHQLAGPGKDLPEEGEQAETEKDETEADAAFAWFGMPLPPPSQAVPAIVVLGQPVATVEAVEGEAPAPQVTLPDLAPGEAALPQGVALDAATPGQAEVAKPLVTGPLVAGDVAPVTDPIAILPQGDTPAIRQGADLDVARVARAAATPARIELAAKIELPADSPILQTIAAIQPRAEAQPFAALAASAGIELPEQFRRPAPRDPAISAITQPGATEILRQPVVQAVAEAQQAAIDTRRSEWMSQTIDRIEALRDTPSTRETSIRLSPDALGTVDVSIRHEGDRVHVRFSAETAQARTLLTEAQSRLTEIAEARGLKLGGTSVDAGVNAGSGGQSQGQRHDAARTRNSAPAAAPGSETSTDTDARVA